MKHPVIRQLREAFKAASDEKSRISGERFFKEEVKLYGVKASSAHKINKALFPAISDLSKAEIFDICEELWKSGYVEESIVACEWSYYLHKRFEPSDFIVFEYWVNNYVTNWAACDTLCNHTVGEFIEMYPEYMSSLKLWALSANRWMKRGSAVSLIIPARKGKFLNDILLIADTLLQDKDDMVQKGYGWMLKAASQAHEDEIFEYVMNKRSVMPRTALRYAIEKMPAGLKKRAMEK
jgi:3-methyladenine DNA glycosylase AlkD